jgi:quercetin dioxygenase-like cupin family protein
MKDFPDFIKKLPEAIIDLKDCEAYLLQSKNQQVIFMQFNKDVELPEHSHESQWEIVLEGQAFVWILGEKKRFKKGDRFFIPPNTPHKAKIFKGYKSIAIFNQKDRYKIK